MKLADYIRDHKVKLTPEEQRGFKHWEQYHLAAFDLTLKLGERIDWKGKKYDGPWIEEQIIKLISKAEKAFGGCVHCYGKGYGTSITYAEGGRSRKKMEVVVPCGYCERGEQVKKLILNP